MSGDQATEADDLWEGEPADWHPAVRTASDCTPSKPCGQDGCEFCDPVGWQEANVPAGGEEQPPAPTAAYLNWPEFLGQNFASSDWLAGDFMQPGGHGTLVGEGKAGKSVFALDWAQAVTVGRPFLGAPRRTPCPVLYIDCENSWVEIQDRALSLGFDAGDLAGLHYLSFPGMPPLDQPNGGSYVAQRVEETGARLVIFDTISRMIAGKENDSDTWLALYRNTMMRLKRAGVGSLRLDHFGKNSDRGARGSSAKTQDVDAVWELTVAGRRQPEGIPLRLARTHSRSGLGQDQFTLWRRGTLVGPDGDQHWERGGTAHTLRASGAGVTKDSWMVKKHLAQLADRTGCPLTAGREGILGWLADKGKVDGEKPWGGYTKQMWTDVAAYRKRDGYTPAPLDEAATGEAPDSGGANPGIQSVEEN